MDYIINKLCVDSFLFEDNTTTGFCAYFLWLGSYFDYEVQLIFKYEESDRQLNKLSVKCYVDVLISPNTYIDGAKEDHTQQNSAL